MSKKTSQEKRESAERRRRAEEKILDNISDYARANPNKDGSAVGPGDLDGHCKVYDLALRKIIETEGGDASKIGYPEPEEQPAEVTDVEEA